MKDHDTWSLFMVMVIRVNTGYQQTSRATNRQSRPQGTLETSKIGATAQLTR